MNIGTRALRHEVHHVAFAAELRLRAPTACHRQDGDIRHLLPPGDRQQHPDRQSRTPTCDPQEWVDDPDDFDRELTASSGKAQVLRLARRMPDLAVPNDKQGVVDLYDVADDWIPIYDRTRPRRLLRRHRDQRQPVQERRGGRALHGRADRAGRGRARPRRRSARRDRSLHGLEIDLGSFSRNREINPDSSFSVLG